MLLRVLKILIVKLDFKFRIEKCPYILSTYQNTDNINGHKRPLILSVFYSKV